ncbi:MAG TPA: class I tRNA ligase family protein, partial [Isosphaeraceae bacterium]|nr:class I tRNA ligase family protein [Isosphaeraceae bacterium]
TDWHRGLDLPALVADLRAAVGSFQYNETLQRIWQDLVVTANGYITQTQPFKLAKSDPDACKAVLLNLAEAFRAIAILLKPFLPRTAESFYRAFNFEEGQAWDKVGYADVLNRPNLEVVTVTAPLEGGKPAPLFPKVETKDAG